MSKLYTIGEVAKALNVALVTIRGWEKNGYVNVIYTPEWHRRIEESEFCRLLGIKGVNKATLGKKLTSVIKELEKERGAKIETYHESTFKQVR